MAEPIPTPPVTSAPAPPSDTGPPPPPADGVRDPWSALGWLVAVIWLVFLVFPAWAILEIVEPAGARALPLALLLLFAAVYGRAFRHLPDGPSRESIRHAAINLPILVGIIALLSLWIGTNTLSMAAYPVALSVYTLPRGWTLVFTGLVLAVITILPLALDSAGPWWMFPLIVLLVAVACLLPHELDSRAEHQRELAQELALSAERDRMARDVHDVLGHSLTVITVKSELAERLVDLDPGRAREEIAQVRSISRQALAEIRATVAGMRVMRLQDELVAAATALAGAGIEADLPDEPDVVDPRHRIVLA